MTAATIILAGVLAAAVVLVVAWLKELNYRTVRGMTDAQLVQLEQGIARPGHWLRTMVEAEISRRAIGRGMTERRTH